MRITLYLFLSIFLQFLIIQVSRRFSFCIDSIVSDKPQRLHIVPTSRAGGLGIFISVMLFLGLVGEEVYRIFFPAAIVFLAGFYEDIRSEVSPLLRLLVVACGPAMCIILSGNVVKDVGLMTLPFFVAAPFTVFAVTGVANAINVIDGVNGLASGVSIMALAFMAAVSYVHNDMLVFNITVVFIVSIAGFFMWNFPKGRIFLGDGGAYFMGYLLAEISILLVNRNSGLSPWFPMVLLVYPVFEVFFSIYRRFKKRSPTFSPDMFHLHTLIFRRVAKSNSKTSVYLWGLVAVFDTAAFFFHELTYALVLIFVFFAITYVCCYVWIVRFGRLKIKKNPERRGPASLGKALRIKK